MDSGDGGAVRVWFVILWKVDYKWGTVDKVDMLMRIVIRVGYYYIYMFVY